VASSHTATWQHGRVITTDRLTDTIVRIEIEVGLPARAEPGAHVDVRVPIDGRVDVRSYSVVDSSVDGTMLALSVHRAPTSRGGAVAMHALRPGDALELTKPMNDFPLRPGADRYLLVAGGVGITAILGMADRLRRLGAEYRLVYAGRSASAMAYLRRIQAEHGDRLSLHVGDEGSSLVVPALVRSVTEGEELYVCGPIRLMDAVRRSWLERRLPPARLRMETFGNSGWFEPQPFTVRVAGTAITAEVGPGETMLEALEAAGADLLSDCRKGECGLCEARVVTLTGDIDHRDVFYSERQHDARSKLCICVSRVVPSGDAAEPASITILPS
jgi:ferredoxin-NADP reductase